MFTSVDEINEQKNIQTLRDWLSRTIIDRDEDIRKAVVAAEEAASLEILKAFEEDVLAPGNDPREVLRSWVERRLTGSLERAKQDARDEERERCEDAAGQIVYEWRVGKKKDHELAIIFAGGAAEVKSAIRALPKVYEPNPGEDT